MKFPPTPAADKIKHLVILMMENRSFDHYLGALNKDAAYPFKTGVDGLPTPLPSNPDGMGGNVQMWNLDEPNPPDYPAVLCMGYPDLPHGPGPQSLNNFDPATNLKLATFVTNYLEAIRSQAKSSAEADTAIAKYGNVPMGYYTRESLPVLYALADNFSVCDRWFSSMLSSTWPNRKYLHCGTRDDDMDTQSVPPFPGFGNRPLWDVLEDIRDGRGDKYTWKNYFTDTPFLIGWYKFAAQHVLHNFTSIDNFVNDCREDQLPTVSILDPAFSLCDDHPTHDIRLGQKFIGLVVDALTHSESWKDTALIITYDENGGFYDHVSPPVPCNAGAQDSPLGFRVPTIVVSPYTPAGVCSEEFDHTSILKSIVTWLELDTDNFPAETFGTRFVCANDIWSSPCFDFGMEPRPTGTYTDDVDGAPPFKDLTWEQGINNLVSSPIGDLEALMERIFILPGLKLLDHRSKVFDHLNAMESTVVNLKRML